MTLLHLLLNALSWRNDNLKSFLEKDQLTYFSNVLPYRVIVRAILDTLKSIRFN